MYFFPKKSSAILQSTTANIFFCRVSDQNVSTERFVRIFVPY